MSAHVDPGAPPPASALDPGAPPPASMPPPHPSSGAVPSHGPSAAAGGTRLVAAMEHLAAVKGYAAGSSCGSVAILGVLSPAHGDYRKPSVRAVAAADRLGVAMCFTGIRHFRH